jgi:SAM-dependent methyltransferase
METEHGHSHQRAHGHGHGPLDAADSAALADLLDLDAQVHQAYLLEAMDWLHQLADDRPQHRIMDLGTGTGSGSIALAQRFAGSEVIAVDQSEAMLARVRDKALTHGLASRIRTVLADLDAAWPAVDPVDVVWASNSLHEMPDTERIFKDIHGALRPGGRLAVVEMDSVPTLLPDDLGPGLGRPGLETRYRAVLAAQQDAGQAPHLGPNWAPALERAGFVVLETRTFTLEVTPAQSSSVGRYARTYLSRIRSQLRDRLDADDLSTLDALLDQDGPKSVLHRDDLLVRGTRTGWIANRP